MPDFETLRRLMVEHQLERRGIADPLVLEAMRKVPREAFVPPELAEEAYADGPLPIGEGQTISQPYIVALMTEALELRGGERVLEIGAGSGYAAAVLAEIAAELYTVERHARLAEEAAARLTRLGYDNVHVRVGDGSLGWPEHAPFDAIVVAAGAPEVPEALKEQLAVGGRLVIPVGQGRTLQDLLRLRRLSETEYQREELGGVRFVPLVGEEGWSW
ncbi:MAG TPA: protein-L-isoaspartate(D-aspartate) O-methyltransferase [Thermoanaerobaculia bacterium]|nr:protein-L-isoaspartate(D-aspartate) O-methyltransferase [Thermoanaerobaculia bacterium]